MKFIKLAGIAGVALLIGGLSGCAELGKVTGGGWMPSEDGDGKANFGFNADSCDAYELDHEWVGINGKFNFHDKDAGVKMKGDVVSVMECVSCDQDAVFTPQCEKCEFGYVVQLDYTSTNPKDRGYGTAWVCLHDNGEGVNAAYSDQISINIEDGPNAPDFAPYENDGIVQGNIQAHECEEEDMLGVAF